MAVKVNAEMLDESIRKQRVPGIVFVDGPTGRRAAVEGTGLDVWEIITTWKEGGGDEEALRRSYPWLTEAQLRAVIAYYEIYSSEIDARLEREAQWTPERIRREFPFSRPRKE
jgi:uncharacterized protein (DUF433 family)